LINCAGGDILEIRSVELLTSRCGFEILYNQTMVKGLTRKFVKGLCINGTGYKKKLVRTWLRVKWVASMLSIKKEGTREELGVFRFFLMQGINFGMLILQREMLPKN
jgi:hypothetical protein